MIDLRVRGSGSASENAVIRPESLASVNGARNFPQGDIWRLG